MFIRLSKNEKLYLELKTRCNQQFGKNLKKKVRLESEIIRYV